MQIEMWSDIICPICGMTQQHLHNAVAEFEHGDEVEIIHRSFQVHPGLPIEGITQTQLSHNAGMTVGQMNNILRPVEIKADQEGFGGYHAIDRTLGPTDLTHELLAYATAQGKHHEAWSGMFKAHFGSNRQLWTVDQLVEFSGEIGLNEAGARDVLTSRRYKAQVEAEQERAQRMGAHGTPFLVIDGKYSIGGGADKATLTRAMGRAWDADHPAPVLSMLAEGDQCRPDGNACAV
ncbi:DsbA family protein [Rhodococcus sp. UFZ-B548]|uniref:DsbA family oxidoreductase n=1 Tax=Rhodococcus sp. UFZ-B548 TaxID=2742212 RepID=UPI0015F6C609|nr:DsbA family protein [Rhodococcus sp. UFZ-B548]